MKKKPFCAQRLSKENFIRTPCMCHSLNLAIKDVFNEKFIIVKEKVIQLINYFNEISKTIKNLSKVPQFKEIRWFSLFYCVSYIIEHDEYIDQSHIEIYNLIQNKFGWEYIFSILKTLEIFMKILENDCSSICDVYPNFQNTLIQIQNINDINHKNDKDNIANEMINSLLNRFSSTVTLSIPIMAFFLTGNGLRKLNELSNQIIVASDHAKTTFNDYIIDEPEKNNFSRFFEFLLNNRNSTILITQQNTFDSFKFWKKVLKGENFWLTEPQLLKYYPEFKGIEKRFAKIVIEILTIPCSETPCERAFSHLGDILTNDKRNLNYEMLNSLLIIRMNSIFLKQDKNSSSDFINNDFEKIIQSDLEKRNQNLKNTHLFIFNKQFYRIFKYHFNIISNYFMQN